MGHGNLGWQVLLLAPLLLVIMALVGLLRRRSGREQRSPIVSLLIVSILAHFGLLFVLDLIAIAVPVAEEHRELIENVLKTFAVLPSHPSPPRSWERLPEGPAPAEPTPEPAEPREAEREVAFAPELRGIEPTITEGLARGLPPERILFVPPPIPPTVDVPPLISPRGIAQVEPELLPAEPTPLDAVANRPEPAPKAPTTTVEKRASDPPADGTKGPTLALADPPRLPDFESDRRPETIISTTDIADLPRPTGNEPAPPALDLPPPEPVELARVEDKDEVRSTSPIELPRTPARDVDLTPTLSLPSRDPTAMVIEPPKVLREPILDIPIPKSPQIPPRLNEFHVEHVAFARDHLELTDNFALRKAGGRPALVSAMGGNETSEAAVKRGLAWLAEHQGPEGNWGLHDLHCRGHRCDAAGEVHGDAAATGLALMAFLGAGHTHTQGQHAEPVRRGIAWLVAHQRPDGDLAGPSDKQMYGHALATIALCEAVGMSGDEALRGPAARALQFIVNAQDPSQGGWRYNPRSGGDTSVVGWQIMALKSGEMAGFSVRPEVYVLARRWLDSVTTGDHRQLSAYLPGQGPSPAMTAEALLCRQYLGLPRTSEAMIAGGDYLKANLPHWGARNAYYWYYATQVMYHLQGDYWTKWNGKLRDMLVESQAKDGPAAGSWHPGQPSPDQFGNRGGRLYETALSLLMLEVYYRNLPLYQQLGGDEPESDPTP